MHGLPLGISDCPSPAPYQPFNRRIKNLCRSGPDPDTLIIGKPYCGCPWQNEQDRCNLCRSPDIIQTRITYPPKRCVTKPCNFFIPPVPCMKPPRKKVPPPCGMDWHVDEPGPNDSYGLNGLNWYDWQMEYHNKEADQVATKEGLSLRPVPAEDFPKLVCNLPVECYSRSPDPVKCLPFPGRVDYARDFRCCDGMHSPTKFPLP